MESLTDLSTIETVSERLCKRTAAAFVGKVSAEARRLLFLALSSLPRGQFGTRAFHSP